MSKKIHIGMRKIKSLLALALTFGIWQVIRIFFPMLEIHPVFAYIYSVIEIRDTVEKTKNFGKLRIKATLVGLVVGLIFVWLSITLGELIGTEWIRILVELALILTAVLIALILGEITGCKTFCGIAAIIAIICMVSHSDGDRYFYAIMRVIQTLIGVFSALIINTFIYKKENNES